MFVITSLKHIFLLLKLYIFLLYHQIWTPISNTNVGDYLGNSRKSHFVLVFKLLPFPPLRDTHITKTHISNQIWTPLSKLYVGPFQKNIFPPDPQKNKQNNAKNRRIFVVINLVEDISLLSTVVKKIVESIGLLIRTPIY